jgi:hypothetical protein
MTIGESRPTKIETSPGPADYSPERGDELTKNRDPTPDFSRTTGRITK